MSGEIVTAIDVAKRVPRLRTMEALFMISTGWKN